jgi:hypothetical protein
LAVVGGEALSAPKLIPAALKPLEDLRNGLLELLNETRVPSHEAAPECVGAVAEHPL